MASVLKDYVHCPICYELFQGDQHEPYALQCLHILCKLCVQTITTGPTFKCPQCKTPCDKEGTKKDFRTKSLVDDYVKEKLKTEAAKDLAAKAVTKCGMCDNTGKVLKSRCIDCQLYLCSDCEKGHKKIPALKSHSIESLATVAKNLETSIKKTMLEFEKLKQATVQGKTTIATECNRIDKIHEEATKKINKCRKKQHKDIDTYHDNLLKQISEEKVNLQDRLATTEVHFQSTVKDIQAKVTNLSELLKKKDKSKILGPGDIANKQVKEDIHNFQSEMAQLLKQKAKFAIDVQDSKLTLDDKTSTKISISSDICDPNTDKPTENKPSNSDSQNITSVESFAVASAAVTAKLEYTSLLRNVEIIGSGRRLNMVGNELWCLTREALHVYDLDGQLLRSTFWEITDEWASSAVQSPIDSNQLLVSFYHSGVQLLNAEGRQLDILCHGEFSDVTIYGDELYALEWEEQRVFVFEYSQSRWQGLGFLQLSYEESHSCDKIHLENDMMFVSSWFNNCIYVFTLEGDPLDTHGSRQGDNNTNVSLDGPKLCTVDPEGSILLADSNNSKLQWCSLSGNFLEVSLPEEIGQPEDAVVNYDDNSVWILTYDGGYKLLKFN